MATGACCNGHVHHHRAWVAIPLLVLLAGCKASGTAKVNASGQGAEGSVEAGQTQPGRPPGEGIWEDNTEAPQLDEPAEAPGKGRQVEGHKGGGVAMATLPGFRMFRDGTSRVFVEVSADVPVKETRAAGVLTYRFQGVVVPEKVNRLDLPTQYFKTPVSRVRMVKVDNDAELIIELRSETKPKTRLRKDQAGTVLSVDFPPLIETRLDDGDGKP
jgi:hypothetical protein